MKIKTLIAINLVWLALWFYFEQSHSKFTWVALLVPTLLLTLIFFTTFITKKISTIFIFDANVVLLFMGITLGFIEISYYIAPSLFPSAITNTVSQSNSALERSKRVQVLNDNPYAKPRPNIKIRIPGNYGPDSHFVYEWETDIRGYKNLPSIANSKSQSIIAIGDSFTEGMGVTVDKTWPSMLTELGYPTYSMGVQGYAPYQFLGTFEKFGLELSPKWVVVGYLEGIYDRESFFMDKIADPSLIKMPSAIGRLLESDKVLRKGHTFFLTAVMNFGWRWIRDLNTEAPQVANNQSLVDDPRFILESTLVKAPNSRFVNLARYKSEYRNIEASQVSSSKLATNVEFESTINSLSQISKLAKTNGVNVLLVLFPSRGMAYYREGTGRTPPKNSMYFSETALLKEFSASQKIFFLDTYPMIEQYMKSLPNDATDSMFPYLKYDGHLSEAGNKIVAKEIAKFFDSQAKPPY